MAFVAWVMRTMLSLYCAHYLSVNTQKIHKETISLQTTFSIHLITMRKTFLSINPHDERMRTSRFVWGFQHPYYRFLVCCHGGVATFGNSRTIKPTTSHKREKIQTTSSPNLQTNGLIKTIAYTLHFLYCTPYFKQVRAQRYNYFLICASIPSFFYE